MKPTYLCARIALAFSMLLLLSCATGTGQPGGTDTGVEDDTGDGGSDIGGIDSGDPDGGGEPDGGEPDGGEPDGGESDGGTDTAGVCGDGVVEGDEQCDAGDNNGAEGEACTEACVIDADRDGADAESDCDDDNASRTPGADEICDGVDNDCDGTVDTDVVAVEVCALPSIDAFEVSAARVVGGATVTVSWDVSAADDVRIDAVPETAAPGDVDALGSVEVTIDGDTTFTLVASSVLGTASLDRTVTVVSTLAISAPAVGDDELPVATIGREYSFTFEAEGGEAPLMWASFDDLPEALSLDDTSGELTGTFDEEGEHTFDIAVTDALTEPQEDVRTVTLRVLPPGATIDTTSLPDAAVGELYVARLAATGGIAPLVWSAEGLPAGLSVSGASIVGTPTVAGTVDVTLTVTDAVARTTSATLPLTVIPPRPTLVTSTLPWAVQLQSYSAMIEATSGTPPYTFSITAGELPTGLSLAAEGAVTGVPTEPGRTTVTVLVTDDTGGTGLGTVTIDVDPVLSIAAAAWPLAAVGTPYDGAIEVTGGRPPYTWEAVSALPDGLSAEAEALRVVGTPTTEGEVFVNVRVTDSRPTPQQVTASLALRVAPAGPTITTTSLPDGLVGETYAATIDVTGGTAPLVWRSSAMPPGLVLDENTGAITGAPTTIFDGDVTFEVEDVDGRLATATLSMVVGADALFIVTEALPAASTGTPYSFALQAAGGVPPYSWRIVLGGLPVGMSLDPDGTISGTTAAMSSASLTVRLSDSSGAGVNAAFVLDVLPGVSIANTDLPDGNVGRPYSETLVLNDATGPVTWQIVGGALPDGLVLLEDGTIFGAPSEAGVFTVTILATDVASRRSIERTFEFEVTELVDAYSVLHGAYTDISSVGTRLDISDVDDSASPAVPIGFPFTFYGAEFTELYVSSNGVITFGGPDANRFTASLPTDAGPTNAIFVFWDDLDPGDGGDVYVHTLGVEPTRRFVVQWRDVDFFSGDNSRINAQAILYEGTNQVQLLYGNSQQGTAPVDFGIVGQDVVAGLQNGDASDGIMLSDVDEQNLLPGTVGLFTPNGASYALQSWVSPVAEWTDIGETGTVSTATGDDAAEIVPIGFNFNSWGIDFDSLAVSTNGYLTFGSLGTDFSNASIPTASGDNGVIAPFWDDLATGSGRIVYQTVGTAPYRRFIVQWDGVQRLGDATGVLYFQAVLHETSNAISFHYAELAGSTAFRGDSATIGIENHEGTDGVQIAFNVAVLEQGDVLWVLPRRGNDTTAYTASAPSPGFEDIRAVGSPVALTNDDQSVAVPIGFGVPWYDETYETINVASNGFASFTSTSAATAGTLGTGSAPDAVAAPFWDDLYPPGSNELLGVWSLSDGEPGNRRFVVQWQSMPHYADRTGSLTFQMTLYESDGAVEYRYGGMRGGTGTLHTGNSATIGMEDEAGARATVFAENVQNAIGSGSWLRMTPR